MFDLTTGPKKTVFFSTIAAIFVLLVCTVDLIVAFPFGRRVLFDVLFAASGACVLAMAHETWRELNPQSHLRRRQPKLQGSSPQSSDSGERSRGDWSIGANSFEPKPHPGQNPRSPVRSGR